MGKTVPLKLEDGTVIGTATVHDNGAIDAVITDKNGPIAKLFRNQLTRGLIEGLSFSPGDEAVVPIIKETETSTWMNDLLRLTPPKS